MVYLDAERALAAGLKLFRSENGVILSPGFDDGCVPASLFARVVDAATGEVLFEPLTVAAFCAAAAAVKSGSSLRSFLSSLRSQLATVQEGASLAPDQFLALIRKAAAPASIESAAAGDSALERRSPVLASIEPAAAGDSALERRSPVLAFLDAQIENLGALEASGVYANEHRGFGVDAADGKRWYNFDVATYLECAGAGFTSARNDGDVVPRLTAEDLCDFFQCGRSYE